jgi:D-alanyl-D-alanine dipeptidase
MRSYQAIPVADCGEPLVAIPATAVAFTEPHPYVALGAPYGGASPWWLRRGVLDALLRAQHALQQHRPGWRLKLFDAWRPVPVQAFMVWREFRLQAERCGRTLDGFADPADLERRDPALYRRLAATVFEFWGVPSDDPLTPPPHSTGAALDVTLQEAAGDEVDMGCPIDETTARAYPDHYATATTPEARAFHARRTLLNEVMSAAGFARHANEWWHFSRGDQMWAWTHGEATAIYGGIASPVA